MSLVTSARKIRDKTPRSLWELHTDCGHYHFELAEEFKTQPLRVTCRVCAAEARLARYRARVASRGSPGGQRGGRPAVLSGPVPEKPAEPFVLDGGVSIPQKSSVQEVAPAVQAQARPLPACMWPRPGSPAPRRVPVDLPVPAAEPAKAPLPGVRRRRAEAPGQTRLFEPGPGQRRKPQ